MKTKIELEFSGSMNENKTRIAEILKFISDVNAAATEGKAVKVLITEDHT